MLPSKCLASLSPCPSLGYAQSQSLTRRRYLHHRLSAPAHLLDGDRVFYLWAYHLLRHPLLASHLRIKSYEDVSFVVPHSHDMSSALASAEDRFIYIDNDESTRDIDIIDSYLNGPRTLSPNRLASLIVADRGQGEDGLTNFEVMLLSTHFLGDGMALHTFMNEFYTLLASTKTSNDFLDMIQDAVGESPAALPGSLEDRMPVIGNGSRFARAVGQVDNKKNDDRLIGGQSFPSNPTKMARKTVVPTFAYTPEETKKILGKCKENGVTIAHAMFALCNLAWARRTESREHSCLIYSALNLRPNMAKSDASYFHLAVGYFSIVLSSLVPPSLSTSELFWYRARQTKAQTVKAVKSPFVVARSRETNLIRRERAIKWAKIDDEEERQKANGSVAPNGGLGLGLGVVQPERKAPSNGVPGPKFAPLRAAADTPDLSKSQPPSPTNPKSKIVLPPASQKALLGLSMLGNLDGLYSHASYPDIHLQSLTTGSRQRPGGLLLFAYTFKGKLWMSLGYDVNGFKEGAIEGFWEEVQALVKEVLM